MVICKKAPRKRDMKKNQSRLYKIWNFIKSQLAGSSMTPDFNSADDPTKEDEDGTLNLGDNSHALGLLVVTFSFSN